MPPFNSRFIYNFYSINDYWINSYSGVQNHPRKGIYNNDQGGWHVFNNIDQTKNGDNAYTEDEFDPECKPRFMFVTITSLEQNSNINV